MDQCFVGWLNLAPELGSRSGVWLSDSSHISHSGAGHFWYSKIHLIRFLRDVTAQDRSGTLKQEKKLQLLRK